MATARISVGTAAHTLLVALLACAAARTAVVVGGTACDGVSCGMGTCSELPAPLLPVPAYECDCDAGWARILPALLFTPCIVPTCSSDVSCYTPTIKVPPPGSNVTLHPCLVVDCGREGMCVEEQDKPFRCQCNSGATNMLNNPSLPCTKNCAIGEDGCPVPNPPPPPPPPSSMAPPDNGTDPPGTPASSSSKGNPTVPTSLAGSVSLQDLLLLASLAALYNV